MFLHHLLGLLLRMILQGKFFLLFFVFPIFLTGFYCSFPLKAHTKSDSPLLTIIPSVTCQHENFETVFLSNINYASCRVLRALSLQLIVSLWFRKSGHAPERWYQRLSPNCGRMPPISARHMYRAQVMWDRFRRMTLRSTKHQIKFEREKENKVTMDHNMQFRRGLLDVSLWSWLVL